MKVKITGCSKSTYWYAKKIGEIFEISEYSNMSYSYKPTVDLTYIIEKCDCKVVSDQIVPLNLFMIEKELFEI
jgi:hypothetical protein